MRLEDVTAEIRPRSDWEAVDLGMALVRRDFWRCLVVWWLALSPLLLVVVGLVLVPILTASGPDWLPDGSADALHRRFLALPKALWSHHGRPAGPPDPRPRRW